MQCSLRNPQCLHHQHHHEQHHLLFWAAHSGLVQAAHSALLQAQAPLPAQPLQALMHFLRWAWAFCILELSLLLYQLTDLGLVQALVFLETALFRLGWCALCRLSPPWFRRFWRFWSVLAFASCPALPWSRLKASSFPLLPFHRHGLLSVP